MLGILEKYGGWCIFDDASGVKNCDAVGERVEDARIMCDQDQRRIWSCGDRDALVRATAELMRVSVVDETVGRG